MEKGSTTKSVVLVVAIAVLLGALVAKFLGSNSPESQRRVTFAQFGDVFLYAPIYIAKDAGFFTKHGLDASFVSTGGDEKTWAAVVSGSADFGVADPLFVAVSAERGRPGVVVANIVNGAPFWGVAFRENIPPITESAMLRGYTVATFPSPSTAYTLQKKMFVDAGLIPSIREVAYGGLLSSLKAEQADIALELEPNVSTAISQGARVVYGLDKVYGDFAITGLTVTPEKLKVDPSLVQSAVCAISDALKFISKRPEEAARLMTQRFPEINESIARSALDRMISGKIVPETVLTKKDAWDKASALRVDAGDLKSPAEYAKFVDNSVGEKCGE